MTLPTLPVQRVKPYWVLIMFRQLLAFEILQRMRQPAFVLIALACLAYGITISFDDIGEGMSMLTLNSPYRQAYFSALCSAFACFIAMIFCSQDALRDDEHGFAELIGLRSPRARWLSRWLVTQGSILFLLSLIALGMLIGFALPRADREALLPLQAAHLLWPWLTFTLPNSLLCGSLLFWVSYRWRQSAVTFAVAMLLFLTSFTLLMSSGAPLYGSTVMVRAETLSWLSLFDPFGLVGFFAETQFLTTLEKDSLTLAPGIALLINRAFWLFVSCAISWHLLRRINAEDCSLQPTATTRASRLRAYPAKTAFADADASKPSSALLGMDSVAISDAIWPRLRALLGHELAGLYRGWAMRLLLLISVLQTAVGILMTVGVFSASEYSGRYPTTSLLISSCTEGLSGFAGALLVLFSVELLWTNKRLRIDPLIDSTAVSNGSVYVAKLLALMSIPLLMISLLIALAAGYQLSVGYTRLEPLHYLSLYWYLGLPLLLQAVTLLFVQVLWSRSRWANRYTALIVGALFAVFAAAYLPNLVAEYPLLQLNQFPQLLRMHSELAGYGQLSQKYCVLAVYWSAIALCIASLSMICWPRGDWRSRMRLRRPRNTGEVGTSLSAVPAWRVMILGLLLSAASGYWLQQQIPEQNDYIGEQSRLDSLEAYERQHAAFRNQPVPQISASVTRVALFPDQQRVEIEADNTVHNRSSTALKQILLSSRRPLQSVSIDGATMVERKSGLGWNSYLFTLQQPLSPGASTQMRYRLKHASHPFAPDTGLVANGSYFHQGEFEPLMGYVEAFEIGDAEQRRVRQLPPRPRPQPDHTHGQGYGRLMTEKRQFESIVSTSSGQMALTSGNLIAQWQQDGRNYFHYRAEQPIYPLVGYFSAAYVKHSFNHRGTTIEFYVHPAHQRNIETMLSAVRATLDYNTHWFGAYSYKQLRLIEVPNYQNFGGRASAGTVALNERLFVEDVNDGALINNVLRNTVHEVAHQWWGEKLTPRITAGEKVITESLAKYVEAVVLGQLHGQLAQTYLNDYNRRRYFSGRASITESERPLIHAQQAYLSYGKGPVVFLALRDVLGELQLNRALKNFLDAHQAGMDANMTQLMTSLKSEASSEQSTLIDRWLGEVTEYRLSVENAVLERRSDGRYAVEVDLIGQRLVYDSKGQSSPATLDEPITVGLFAEHPDRSQKTALALQTVLLKNGRQHITLLSDQHPSFIAIDPAGTRIEANREDNILQLKERW